MTTTALYRFYDDRATLLYVGITNNLPARLGEHARDKAWFYDVCRVDVTRYATRQEAADAERQAITTEGPRHNVIHNGRAGKAAAVVPSPRRPGEYPVAIDEVVALGCRNGQCPVGLVGWVGDAGVRLDLYSWLGAHFGYDTRLVPWDDIVDLRWGHAIERADDAVVYDMDPLADFQDEWHAA